MENATQPAAPPAIERPALPHRIYAWGITQRDGKNWTRNPVGVCGDLQQAMRRVGAELRETPAGSFGQVAAVPVNEPFPVDDYKPPLWIAHLDAEHDCIVWTRY